MVIVMTNLRPAVSLCGCYFALNCGHLGLQPQWSKISACPETDNSNELLAAWALGSGVSNPNAAGPRTGLCAQTQALRSLIPNTILQGKSVLTIRNEILCS